MTALKVLIFVVALSAAYPCGRWLRLRARFKLGVWTLVGFLPFIGAFDIGLVTFTNRPGDTYGIEVAIVDFLTLALFFARRRWDARVPHLIAFGSYFLAALIAVGQATWLLTSFGYVWKLGRMYLLYAAVWSAHEDERVPAAILRGLVFGVLYEGLFTMWQHFALNIHAPSGSFGHQNALGGIVNMITMVPISLIIAGRATKLAKVTAAAGIMISVLTASRGAMGLCAVGVVLVYALSAARNYSPRKAALGLAGLALGAVLVPIALSVLASRTPADYAASNASRRDFERAAALMFQEHPLGVGPNQFSMMMLAAGYGERGGVNWGQRVDNVHNIYWLTAAEMGYPGLVALIFLFGAPLLHIMRSGLRARHDPRGDVLVGIGAALTIFYVHGFVEWFWRDTAVSYVYWMIVASGVVLAQQVCDQTNRIRAGLQTARAVQPDVRDWARRAGSTCALESGSVQLSNPFR